MRVTGNRKQGTGKSGEYTSRIKNPRHQRNDLSCVRIAQSRETLRSEGFVHPSHNVETHYYACHREYVTD